MDEDEVRADMEAHVRELRAADELIRSGRNEPEGLGYGQAQVNVLGDEIKRLVFDLSPGEKITFERHNPSEQKDGRWFTVSRPV